MSNMNGLFFCLAVACATSMQPTDIVGYYGNSGAAISFIPTLDAVHQNYNVLILTFASIDVLGNVSLDIQGPYQSDRAKLKADILVWKARVDPYSRTRAVLVSVGGQNGQWPSGLPADTVEAGLRAFMLEYELDGLDIDLEGQVSRCPLPGSSTLGHGQLEATRNLNRLRHPAPRFRCWP